MFSKTLHWISDYQILANTVAEMGFDGIDLTVRPEGHVLPEKVILDLPKAVQAAKIAKMANVSRLLLGHISARYEDTSKHHAEAIEIFPNSLVVEDGDTFEIDR